jgi:phosphate transport system substrate-binding protein
MTLWTEEFKRQYPNVNIQVQAAGSSTAPPALTEGTASFGPMSRAMTGQRDRGLRGPPRLPPTAIRVAIDALAVYVHKDNPLESLTIPQADAIFSVTRRCGADANVARWGDLGLTGTWANRPLQLYGRNSVSGTYGYFKQVALCSGDFKNNVNEQPGSASVVQAVSSSLNGDRLLRYRLRDLRRALRAIWPSTKAPSPWRPPPRTPSPATIPWPAFCTST